MPWDTLPRKGPVVVRTAVEIVKSSKYEASNGRLCVRSGQYWNHTVSSWQGTHGDILGNNINERQWIDQALQRQAEVENGFVAPTAHEFGNLRNWHRHPNMGNHFLTFETEDAWDLMGEKGLIAKDFFAVADTGNYLAYWLGIWYCALRRKAQLTLQNAKGLMRRCCARKPHASNSSASNNAHDPEKASDVNQIQSLSDNGADRITSGVVTILASVLLVVPIYALYVVHRLKVRLGLVCLFTVLLAAMTTFALRMSTEKVLAISTA